MFSTAGTIATMFLRIPSAGAARTAARIPAPPPLPRLGFLPPVDLDAALPSRDLPGRPRQPVRPKVPRWRCHQVPTPVDRLSEPRPVGKPPGALPRCSLFPHDHLEPGAPALLLP